MSGPDGTAPANLHEHERAIRAQALPSLRDYLVLSARQYNVFVQCGDALAGRDLSPAAGVMLRVAARVLGDLRICQWAAEHGYALQACSVAATIHELAYGAAFIGDSDDRAAEWLAHGNEKRQYPESGHAAVLHAVMKRLALSSAHADQEYRIYRELCLAKHGNPILQRAYGLTYDGEARLIEQVPYYSEATVRLARFGLFHAMRAMAILLMTLVQTHFADALSLEAVKEIAAIQDEMARLGTRGKLYEVGPDGTPIALAT